MSVGQREMREHWNRSFREQAERGAFNTAPVEPVVRTVAYFLRDRHPDGDVGALRFLELGCGAGPNLAWLAEKGARVSGIDVSPVALALAQENLRARGLESRVDALVEGSVAAVALPDASFDGIVESCVLQHLRRADREAAFAEVGRLLKPGGVFVGYLLEQGHSVYAARRAEEEADDPGTIVLADGRSDLYLTNLGVSHFFTRDEVRGLLGEFSEVDPCLATYELPRAEAARRGYEHYRQSMLVAFAVK